MSVISIPSDRLAEHRFPMRVLLAFVLALAATVSLASQVQRSTRLEDRFPVPEAYERTSDDESTETMDFSTAGGVRGRVLRRTYLAPAGAKHLSTAGVVTHFADLLHGQGGAVFTDRFGASGGGLQGRIPAARPVWLVVGIAGGGRELEVIALEEDPPVSRPMPTEERHVPGLWDAPVNLSAMLPADRDAASRLHQSLASLAAPVFRPLQGWAWKVELREFVDGSPISASLFPYQLSVWGLERWQGCTTCAIETTTHGVGLLTVDVNRVASIGEPDQATLAADGFFLDPEATRTTPQISTFKDGGRLLVVRAGRPPLYLPATREGYLQARIRFVQGSGRSVSGELDAAAAEFEAAMKELEKTNPAAARQARVEFAESRKLMGNITSGGVTDLQSQLAGLSADEKRAPATDPVGRRVVRLNPAYFETGRGRTAPHFVVVDIPTRYDVGQISLYQLSLIDKLLASVELTELVR